MAAEIIMNTMNQLQKGRELYKAGEAADAVYVLVKGRAMLLTENIRISAGSGDFLGLLDLCGETRETGCVITEDAVVFAFSAGSISDIRSFLTANKEYGGRMIVSASRIFLELYRIREAYRSESGRLPGMVKELNRQYLSLCLSEGMRAEELPGTIPLVPPFTEEADSTEALSYYLELSRIPAELSGKYYCSSALASVRFLSELLPICRSLLSESGQYASKLRKTGSLLINSGSDNLFFYLCTLMERAKKPETKKTTALLIERTEKKLTELSALFEQNAGKAFAEQSDRRAGRKLQEELLEAEEPCEDSFEKILSYGEAKEELTLSFSEEMKQFKELIDITSSEDDIRKLRKQLADHFYELYEMVFLKAYGKERKELSIPVRLFLEFGFLDETLVSRTRLLELERLNTENEKDTTGIYTIREWLTMVYSGKREPSKNEFDQEYAEMLREQMKNGVITEDEMEEQRTNSRKRLHYEVMNLFRYNNRLVNGQLSIFIPFLCEDLLMGSAAQTFLSKRRVKDALDAVRRFDFSLFYREFLYMNKNEGIEREYCVREILPDIILLPTSGSKSIMWQELSCRRRDTGGRFLFPIFAEIPPEDLMIRAAGRYRWELCRTLQGTSWNNVQIRSLTSEYSDYLMYYKKNHDISDEKKERVKLQLQKGKNSYREVFAMDYETWIRFEANGAIKLNKVARELLATYCPLSKSIRIRLVQQPVFEEAMGRQQRDLARKLHETELRHHALLKDGIELPKELLETLEYYKER